MCAAVVAAGQPVLRQTVELSLQLSATSSDGAQSLTAGHSLLLQIIEHAEAVKRANELDNELDLLNMDQEGLRRATADAEAAKVCLSTSRGCSLAC